MHTISLLLCLPALLFGQTAEEPFVVRDYYFGGSEDDLFQTGDTLWGLFELADTTFYLGQCQIAVESSLDSSYDPPQTQVVLSPNNLLPTAGGYIPERGGTFTPILFSGLDNPVAGLIEVAYCWDFNRIPLQLLPDSTYRLQTPGTIDLNLHLAVSDRAYWVILSERFREYDQIIYRSYEHQFADGTPLWCYPYIRFAGDIDRDHHLDLILDGDDCGELFYDHSYFLSSAAKEGEIVHRISHIFGGCEH